MYDHFAACAQFDFPTIVQFRIPCLGNCAAYGGHLSTSVNFIGITSHGYFHRPMQYRQSLMRLSFQVILGCVKLKFKLTITPYHSTSMPSTREILIRVLLRFFKDEVRQWYSMERYQWRAVAGTCTSRTGDGWRQGPVRIQPLIIIISVIMISVKQFDHHSYSNQGLQVLGFNKILQVHFVCVLYSQQVLRA